MPIEKAALDGPIPLEILAGVAAQTGDPECAIDLRLYVSSQARSLVLLLTVESSER